LASIKYSETLVNNQLEYLTNLDLLEKTFKSKGYKIILNESIPINDKLSEDANWFVKATSAFIVEKL